MQSVASLCSSGHYNDDLVFLNVRQKPFDIYGLYHPTDDGVFKRMPVEEAAKVSPGVHGLSLHTSGGRVRFATDSDTIAIRVKIGPICAMPTMALSGTAGFDLYVDQGDKSIFYKVMAPPLNLTDGYETAEWLPDRQLRQFTLYFPLYANVVSLEIGLKHDARIGHGAAYAQDLPVYYYGSSITQGASASRPGLAYPAIISRKLNRDFVNLGLCASALGEDAIIDYIADQSMSVFVCDYDHNTPSTEHLAQTYPRIYEKIRAKHPNLPMIFVTRPNFDENPGGYFNNRDAIYNVYRNAVIGGDQAIDFVDGERLYKEDNRDSCTVDNCHPNDAGHLRMAELIGYRVEQALHKAKNGFSI